MSSSAIIQLSACTVNLTLRQIEVHESRTIPLTVREEALLRHLVANPSRTISREELLQDVWGYAPSVISRAADNTFSRLRAKLENDPRKPSHLITVHGEGYRFEPLTTEAAPIAPASAAPQKRIVLQACALELTHQRVVRNDGEVVQLSGTEVLLLEVLLESKGDVVRREALLRKVWGRHANSSKILNKAIWRLRQKIEQDPNTPQNLITIRGRGFRLHRHRPERSGSLPTRRDQFIGRTTELEQLSGLMDREQPRAVVLMGAGGVGKTRLAEQLGALCQDRFPDGVWFCDLSHAVDIDGVVKAVSIGLDTPLTQSDPLQQLSNVLQGRGRLLLILDNIEQVLEPTTALMRDWLRCAPDVRFLVTSRRRPQLTGAEVVVLGALAPEQAVALFEARAREARSDFSLDPHHRAVVMELCQVLERHCLAIELAAARLRILPPAQLLARLSQRFRVLRGRAPEHAGERHATLWAVIDWSWQSLSDVEQSALVQCALFQGGLTLDAAEVVITLPGGANAPDVMDVIQSLVDHSLLRTAEGPPDQPLRFLMDHSLSEFAAVKMKEMGDAEAIMHRHGMFFSTLGEAAQVAALLRHGGLMRRQQLALEFNNLSAAAENMLSMGALPQAMSCAVAMAEAIRVTGPYGTTLSLIERILAAGVLPVDLRLRAGRVYVWLLRRHGRQEDALAQCRSSLTLAREAGMRHQEGLACADLALMHWVFGQSDISMEHFQDAIRILEAVGDRAELGRTLSALAPQLSWRGQRNEAIQTYQTALEIHRAVGDQWSENITLMELGSDYVTYGQLAQGEPLLKRALQGFRDQGYAHGEGVVLCHLADLHQLEGRDEDAYDFLMASLKLHRGVGTGGSMEGVSLGNLGDVCWRLGRSEEAQQHLEQAVAILDTAWPMAAGVFRGSLALLYAQRGELERAWMLLRQSEALVQQEDELERGKLLCKKHMIAGFAGDSALAAAALAEARAIADAMGPTHGAQLHQLLRQLDVSSDVPPPSPSSEG